MKIENCSEKLKQISELLIGSCFRYNDSLFIKTIDDPNNNHLCQGVDLNFGNLEIFAASDFVEPISAKVVIE